MEWSLNAGDLRESFGGNPDAESIIKQILSNSGN